MIVAKRHVISARASNKRDPQRNNEYRDVRIGKFQHRITASARPPAVTLRALRRRFHGVSRPFISWFHAEGGPTGRMPRRHPAPQKFRPRSVAMGKRCRRSAENATSHVTAWYTGVPTAPNYPLRDSDNRRDPMFRMLHQSNWLLHSHSSRIIVVLFYCQSIQLRD